MSITEKEEVIVTIGGKTQLFSKEFVKKALRAQMVEEEMKGLNSLCANYEKDNIDPIVEAVREKLLNRSKIGIKKYGEHLGNYSKYNFIVEMQNEALDFANYCEVELQKEETINQLIKQYPNYFELGEQISKIYGK